MFDKVIPWKRTNHEDGNRLSVHHDDDPITALRHDFDKLLSRFWDEGSLSRRDAHNWLAPSVQLDDNDKEYVMTAELPGFDPDDIDVKVSGHLLTIKAEHKEETSDKHGRMHRYGSFFESFTLPSNVKADEIDARYHSGILEIHVPKDETAPTKRIEVRAA